MVLLVATREVRYAAKQYRLGDKFEASEKDARILKAIKKAKDAPPTPAPVPVAQKAVLPTVTAPTPTPVRPPEPAPVVQKVAPEPLKDKEEAKDPVPAPEAAPKEPPVGVVPTSTTTRYRRRDLQPQE